MTQGISEVLGEGAKPGPDPFAGNLPAPDAHYQAFSFSAARFVLATLASRAGAVIPSRDFQPVLKDFLVEVSADGITMVATDMELTIVVTSPAVTVPEGQGPVRAVLPARRLQAILAAAPDEEVTISVSGDEAIVAAGHASWKLKLSSDSSDYPDVTGEVEGTTHSLPRKPFLEAVQAVKYAVSRAGTKPQYMQVNFSPDAMGAMVATASDNSRFARARVLDTCPVSLRIPATGGTAAIDELVRLLSASQAETFWVRTDGQSKLLFQVGSTTLIASMLGKPYPDVEKLILGPALENNQVLTVDRRELQQAVIRSRINADEATSALGLRLSSGQLAVYSRDKYQNTASEVIPAGWEGGTRTLIVNHKFLTDMLSVHPVPSCTFLLGADKGTRKSRIMLTDAASGVTGIISQMAAAVLVGYDS